MFRSLQSTHITRVSPSMFSHLPSLQILSVGFYCYPSLLPINLFVTMFAYCARRLDLNEIRQLEPLAMAKLTSLRHLRLDVNRFDSVPSATLSHLNELEVL